MKPEDLYHCIWSSEINSNVSTGAEGCSSEYTLPCMVSHTEPQPWFWSPKPDIGTFLEFFAWAMFRLCKVLLSLMVWRAQRKKNRGNFWVNLKWCSAIVICWQLTIFEQMNFYFLLRTIRLCFFYLLEIYYFFHFLQRSDDTSPMLYLPPPPPSLPTPPHFFLLFGSSIFGVQYKILLYSDDWCVGRFVCSNG